MKTNWFVIACCLFLGCQAPTFTDLGNGVAVPVETVEKYAAQRGVTRDQARAELKAQTEAHRASSHDQQR